MRRSFVKAVFAAVLCVLLAFSMAACGGGGEPASAPETEPGGDQEAPPAEETPAAEVIKWNVGTINTDPAVSDTYNAEGHALALFAEKVKEYTNGAVEVTVHWGGTLGANPQLLEQVQMGETDVFCGMPMSTSDPRFNAFSIPFTWDNLEQVDKAIDGGNGEIFKITEKLFAENNMHLAGMGAGAFRGYGNSKKEVLVPGDLKGVKTRVYESELVRAFWDGLTQTQMMSAMDIYTGMETGAVDGFENANTVMMVLKYYEVLKYFVDLNWQWANSAVYVVSDKAWTALTPEQQEAVKKAAWEAGALETAEQSADQAKANEDLAAKDITVSIPTDAQRQEWIDYSDSLVDTYKKIVGEEFYNEYMAAVEAGK
ncbi:MAG: TRAP transporter substrate-binding protein [Clostridiales Family XIII bacterium]|jgi:TRAP-type C4-dicarboxylate transport system substrate-binding protein|nr:TRAP transporter substrate-binding protein [Clostridiales Family XIII bacterium]